MNTNDTQSKPARRDYSATLNLPKPDVKNGAGDGLDASESAIPLRASLPLREPMILERWRRERLYERTLSSAKPRGKFILHDGPPYSNGNIHLGHALNKILKDLIMKSRSMAGYESPYVPGWDNHGLPIETAVTKEYRERKQTPTPLELRKRCREYAVEWVRTQSEQFQRLGVNGNWAQPYMTMSAEFEADIVAGFRTLVERGYIYRGLKPVHWCITDRTALADAEIEYADKDDLSIYVAFPLLSDPDGTFADAPGDGPISAIAWTTTPWTIPANLALAVHPDGDYVLVAHGGRRFLVGRELIGRIAPVLGWGESVSPLDWERKGGELAGAIFRHPLYDRDSPIVTAGYVTFEDGTGIVHTAPGHGRDDFETGQKHNLDVLSPVDDGGRFTAEAGSVLQGLTIWEGNPVVVRMLEEVEALVGRASLRHSYPHCWRCHQPVIFRATRQWFMSIDHAGHRERSLDAIKSVRWYPPEAINRISAMVSQRPDWCLSRQRIWGVGIPVFYCRGCDGEILELATIAHVESLIRQFTSDVWFERDAADLLPKDYRCPHCGAAEFGKETDIFDVWFDSGSTNRAVLASGRWPDQRWPADVYLEGGDQHRGWFMSSLMIGVATKDDAPFRAVVTNGWTLDEHGKAMHKSAGNAVSPDAIVSQFGADVLRLWVASTDYFDDVRLGKKIIDQTVETYRRLRNTLRFGLSNLYDFEPARDAVALAELREIDRYALHRVAVAAREALSAYDGYEFHRVTQALHQLAAVDLSAFYFDVLKDALYAEAANSPKRRSAQTAVHQITLALTTLLAPVLSFTCDEVWEKLPIAGHKAISAQLAGFHDLTDCIDQDLGERWQRILAFRDEAYRSIEAARQAKQIGKPLEAHVVARVPAETKRLLERYAAELNEILLVSRVDLVEGDSLSFEIVAAQGDKCARCWLIKPDVDPATGLCGRCAAVVGAIETVGP